MVTRAPIDAPAATTTRLTSRGPVAAARTRDANRRAADASSIERVGREPAAGSAASGTALVAWWSNGVAIGSSVTGVSADASVTGVSADASVTGVSANASVTGVSAGASVTGVSADASVTGVSADVGVAAEWRVGEALFAAAAARARAREARRSPALPLRFFAVLAGASEDAFSGGRGSGADATTSSGGSGSSGGGGGCRGCVSPGVRMTVPGGWPASADLTRRSARMARYSATVGGHASGAGDGSASRTACRRAARSLGLGTV